MTLMVKRVSALKISPHRDMSEHFLFLDLIHFQHSGDRVRFIGPAYNGIYTTASSR